MNKQDSTMDISAAATEWMAQLTAGEFTPMERVAFTDWLRESPTHVRALLELTLLRHDLTAAPLPAGQIEQWVEEARAGKDAGVIEHHSFVARGTLESTRRKPATVRDRGRIARLAAGVAAGVAVLACAVAWYGLFHHNRYATGFGEQRIVTLQDGSVVSLNTNSALRVRFSAEQRLIELYSGEAFFRVARDADRPFEVLAGDATVKALGTQFNVRMDPGATVVSVVDGLVEVRNAADQADQLNKGQEARILPPDRSAGSAGASIVTAAIPSVQRASAWTRGRVEFEAVSMEAVVAEFQRYRRVEVVIDDSALRSLRLTGSFDAHDPESALAYIDSLPGVRVKHAGSGAYVIQRIPAEID